MPSALDELLARIQALPADVQDEVKNDAMSATAEHRWVPNIGPQTAAYFCEADELLYGGEAGGGKSDLLLGLALNEHKRARVLRRVNQDAAELGDRLVDILGTSKGYSAKPPTWRNGGQLIELRGCEHEKDKQRFKGKARDFIGYDELADFLESQYVFINTWNRSVDPNQRCRVVGATNGPTTAEGQWLVRRWAAWLDPTHPKPAKDGELRWYLQTEDGEVEVDGPGPHDVNGKPRRATSRTFIRSRLSDNPDLAATDYGSKLDGLPEELRRVYRDGDFTSFLKDDNNQVIPTAWIEAAMQRWENKIPARTAMTAMAVDVAPGGGDQRVIAWRYGGWFAPLDAEKVVDKSGRLTAASVVKHRRDRCPVVVDLGGGWGGDAVIAMKDNGIAVYAFMGLNPSTARTRDGKLKIFNKRAEVAWKFREELDPSQEGGSAIALPPDPELKSDLASYRWFLSPQGIKLEDKDDQKDRLGRSPDRGDAVLMCLAEGERVVERELRKSRGGGTPRVNIGHSQLKKRR
ncbi:hypothetical protein ACVWW6_006042 [Bradyrhizobium sp. USDA 3311]